MSIPIPFPAPRSCVFNETPLNLIDPPADGRSKFWGQRGMQKYYPPSGHIEDNQVIQDGCWKASVTGENRLRQMKKVDRRKGNDSNKCHATRMFLHHRGASRESNARPGGGLGSTLPMVSSRSRSVNPSGDLVKTLLRENASLKGELRSMKQLIQSLSTKVDDLNTSKRH